MCYGLLPIILALCAAQHVLRACYYVLTKHYAPSDVTTLSGPRMAKPKQIQCSWLYSNCFNSSPGQGGRHFADDIFKCIFMSNTFCVLIRISLKILLKGPINISHWFRWWRDAEQLTSHYLRQLWHNALTHIRGTKGRCLLRGVTCI